jgi:hypothetical protein
MYRIESWQRAELGLTETATLIRWPSKTRPGKEIRTPPARASAPETPATATAAITAQTAKVRTLGRMAEQKHARSGLTLPDPPGQTVRGDRLTPNEAIRIEAVREGLLKSDAPADRRHMGGTALAEIYCVGGALLGLWAFVRFPARAPSTLGRAMLALLAAMCVLAVVPALLTFCIDSGGRAGGVLGLLGLVLPALSALFWATACVFREFCGLLSRGAR